MSSRRRKYTTNATYAPASAEMPEAPHRVLMTKCIVFGCDRPVSDLRWALGHYTCGRHERAGAARRPPAVERTDASRVFLPAAAFTVEVNHEPAA